MVKRVIYASKNDINQKMDVNFHENLINFGVFHFSFLHNSDE